MQLLRELIPSAAVFGVLADPGFPATPSIIADLQVAAHTLGLPLVVVNARTDRDLETAFVSGAVGAKAFQDFTQTVPVVFVQVADPVPGGCPLVGGRGDDGSGAQHERDRDRHP